MNKKFHQMRQVKDDVTLCRKCCLYKKALNPVIGQGSHDAQIMFIGEGPGANEDKTGIPFCGRAGKILDELLKSIDIKREDVYIANIVKHRPPGNRDPKLEEISACVAYLDRQIDIIKPRVICPLGRFAAYYIMEKFDLKDNIEEISKMHGKSYEVQAPHGSMAVIPLYHPAVAIYNIHMLPEIKKDFKKIKSIL
jgi:DNA polymerase